MRRRAQTFLHTNGIIVDQVLTDNGAEVTERLSAGREYVTGITYGPIMR